MNKAENISVETLRHEIMDFNNDLNVQKLEAFYNSSSFWEIIGVSRKEKQHSNFIAWILNNNEIHSLGKFPIQKFLEILVINSKEKQLESHNELFNTIIVSDYEISEIQIETEKAIKIKNSNYRFIDIFIQATISYMGKDKLLKIVVENKVSTKEHTEQTTAYFNYFEEIKKPDETILYVYLQRRPV